MGSIWWYRGHWQNWLWRLFPSFISHPGFCQEAVNCLLETNDSNSYLSNVCGILNTNVRWKWNPFCSVIVPKGFISMDEFSICQGDRNEEVRLRMDRQGTITSLTSCLNLTFFSPPFLLYCNVFHCILYSGYIMQISYTSLLYTFLKVDSKYFFVFIHKVRKQVSRLIYSNSPNILWKQLFW